MCNFASLVLTRNRAHWLPDSESHSEIIRRCELRESGTHGLNVVKVEIVPDGGPVEQWPIRFDQDMFPSWHGAMRSERRARAALVGKLKALTTLDASYSKITDVSKLTKLTTLDARYSKITKKQIAALRARGCTVYE